MGNVCWIQCRARKEISAVEQTNSPLANLPESSVEEHYEVELDDGGIVMRPGAKLVAIPGTLKHPLTDLAPPKGAK